MLSVRLKILTQKGFYYTVEIRYLVSMFMLYVQPKTNDLFKRDLVLGYEILIYIHGLLCSEYLLHAWF